ncbi:hypothetical protein K438DRAFT_1985736 [Mycena galopus ATCC 62051]|nr:hypothetical protein K438DRAFT_1985736 [Mycena galopus ATCC 62051]
MVSLRVSPTGTVQITGSKGKAYLYTGAKPTKVIIRTETRRPRLHLAPSLQQGTAAFRILQLPYLDYTTIFTITPDTVIHDCIVKAGTSQFLISAYYGDDLPTNEALKEVAPGYDFHGEVVIVALGSKVPYTKRMNAALAKQALLKFLSAFLHNMHMKKQIPAAVTGAISTDRHHTQVQVQVDLNQLQVQADLNQLQVQADLNQLQVQADLNQLQVQVDFDQLQIQVGLGLPVQKVTIGRERLMRELQTSDNNGRHHKEHLHGPTCKTVLEWTSMTMNIRVSEFLIICRQCKTWMHPQFRDPIIDRHVHQNCL